MDDLDIFDLGENDAPAPQVPFQGLYDWMQSIVMVFFGIILLLTFVGRTMAVEGLSMAPTLLYGDRMIVRSILYTPQRGDVVIFARHDFEDGAALVKRVIALEGDVVDVNPGTGFVYLNGEALYEPYANEPLRQRAGGEIHFPHTVPEGHVFVIGDNRNNSTDSRNIQIGPVDEREIIGQVVAVIMPFARIGLIRG
jgi:signal peptidase I